MTPESESDSDDEDDETNDFGDVMKSGTLDQLKQALLKGAIGDQSKWVEI